MFKNLGTRQPKASQYVNGDMASEWEELVELDDVQLATVVGGLRVSVGEDIVFVDVENGTYQYTAISGFQRVAIGEPIPIGDGIRDYTGTLVVPIDYLRPRG